jgi:hypothetical protein
MRCLATAPAILAALLGNPRNMPELRRVTGRTRIEDELRRERQASSATGGGGVTPKARGGAAPAVTDVLEYRPHEDGYLQLELRRYVRRTARPALAGPTGTSPQQGSAQPHVGLDRLGVSVFTIFP